MTTRYIAKPNTFFDPGTEAYLVEQVPPHSISARFRGIYYGERKIQLCQFSEFEQIWGDDDDNSVRD